MSEKTEAPWQETIAVVERTARVFATHVGVLCGALYRIAQGVEDPQAAAILALRRIGAGDLADVAEDSDADPKAGAGRVWRSMDTAPMDGSSILALDEEGDVHKVRWLDYPTRWDSRLYVNVPDPHWTSDIVTDWSFQEVEEVEEFASNERRGESPALVGWIPVANLADGDVVRSAEEDQTDE